jgi:hypothetical protein
MAEGRVRERAQGHGGVEVEGELGAAGFGLDVVLELGELILDLELVLDFEAGHLAVEGLEDEGGEEGDEEEESENGGDGADLARTRAEAVLTEEPPTATHRWTERPEELRRARIFNGPGLGGRRPATKPALAADKRPPGSVRPHLEPSAIRRRPTAGPLDARAVNPRVRYVHQGPSPIHSDDPQLRRGTFRGQPVA